ncbi:hypothetical protein DKX38_003014 [Salix brachista]|uniref:Myb-like domain-containing protein n=1 Tax=Salix brachista TaxID=2182728 RepID=A0A5N5NRK6_9ROSI|nr:hypothetical protein DKX38_003014 [Salix brachista]
MDDLPRILYGWSWEENKLFEMALAVVDEEDPDRWKVVAAMVGGKKSEEDVQKHYVILLEDLQGIESGKLDHTLVGEAHPCVQADCSQSVCWNDEDHKYVADTTGHKLIGRVDRQFISAELLLLRYNTYLSLVNQKLPMKCGSQALIVQSLPFIFFPFPFSFFEFQVLFRQSTIPLVLLLPITDGLSAWYFTTSQKHLGFVSFCPPEAHLLAQCDQNFRLKKW